MKKCFLAIAASFLFHFANANDNDSTVYYNLHDSVKVVQFMAEINVQAINSKKELFAGIKTDVVKLSLESDKKGKEIVLNFRDHPS